MVISLVRFLLRSDLYSRLERSTILLFVFVGLLAALGFSLARLAILRKKKMMEENNK